MPDPREERPGAEPLATLAVIAVALALVWPLRGYGLIPNDEGWLLHPALRVQGGEVLYRDVWVHYAPLRFHLIAAVFDFTGPSFLAARTVLALLIAASSVGLFRIALRFAPPTLALVPAVAYAFVPGPWYDAFYAFCTVVFFLALARALERPDRGRLAWLGAAVGLSLVTRHELGLAQLALGLAAIGLRCRSATGGLRALGPVVATASLPCLVVAAYYASQGALPGLGEALFVRAFGQLEGNDPAHLRRLFSLETFGTAIEGRLAGAVLLSPLVLYPTFALLLLRDWRRRKQVETTLLGATLLGYALATLPQSFTPPLIVRFLQAAAPYHLIAAWACALALPGRAWSALPAGLIAAGLVAAVVGGIPRVDPSDSFTGSLRMRRGDALVRILGDTVRTDWGTAEEIRLVRSFVGARTQPGEPVFAAPWLSLYYVLLERPNPTGYVFERMGIGDFTMSDERKRAEMERLLESPCRYAIVLRRWWLDPPESDSVRRTLHEHFATVRDYRSLLVLERTRDASLRAFSELHREARRGQPGPDDAARLARLVQSLPDEPLPASLLGAVLLPTGESERGVALLERAVALDPANPEPLEWLARFYLRAGRPDAARDAIQRASAVRDSPALRELRAALP